MAAQHQAALRLQAAARGFLAQWRLQKAHKQMRDREAALAAVALAFDAEGCDLDSLDGYQQLCRSAAVSKVRMVSFPQTAYSNSTGMVVGEVCSSLSPAGTHYLAPQLSVYDHRGDVSAGLRCDCFQVVVLLRSSHSDGLHGIQVVIHMQHHHVVCLSFRWSPWNPGGRTHATSSCGWCLPSASRTIKNLSLFQIKKNQISRDVKGFF
jgi:hypothetical protein